MCTTTCRTATWDRCLCECNGANHGMYVVTPLFDAHRDTPRRPRVPRARLAAVAVEHPAAPARVWSDAPLIGLDLDDIESWLDGHTSDRAQVTALVDAASGADPSFSRRGDAADVHIVCTLLVSTVIALEQIDELRGRIVDGITSVLTTNTLSIARSSGRTPEPLDFLADQVLTAATRRVVDLVVGAALPGSFVVDPVTLQNLRIATILTCPDIDAHPEVRDHCVGKLAVAMLDGAAPRSPVHP